MKFIFYFIFILAVHPPAKMFANEGTSQPCDGKRYSDSAHKLKKITEEDQKDRENFQNWTANKAMEVLKKDRIRRLRVSGLFSRGCLKSADDYLYAATVFQHGEVPDHFFQTFI